MKAGPVAAATGAGATISTSNSSRPSSPLGSGRSSGSISSSGPSIMRRTLLLASALASLGLLGGVGLLVGKGKAPAAGSRFLAQRVLVRSSTTAAPARRLSVPAASLTGTSTDWLVNG